MFRAVRLLKRGIRLIIQPLKPLLRLLAQGTTRWILLPLYAAFTLSRIRLGRMIVSARGFFFLLLTNRYLFHATLVLISGATVATQLTPNSAAAYEASQRSLLYALVSQGHDELVEERGPAGPPVKDANYLGPTTLSVAPGIDFDYEPQSVSRVNLTVPGSIAIEPGTQEVPSAPAATRPGSIAATPPAATSQPTVPAPAEAPPVVHGTRTYTIKSGDTVSGIARAFGVDRKTIVWANPGLSIDHLKLGASLRIPQTSGVLHVVKRGDTLHGLAQLYQVDASAIAEANQLSPNRPLRRGRELMIPGATPVPLAAAAPAPQPAPAPEPAPAPDTSSQDTTPDTSANPADTANADTSPAGGTDNALQDLQVAPAAAPKPQDASDIHPSSGKLLWPTQLHTINQYYGWQHTGVDIDGDYTDPIYAADDGVVEKAGWNNGGYGLMVMIDHQDGVETRYGHASKLFVSPGDHVKRGQVIAMVGTTGRSTGTHLHFEVYVDGQRRNPLAYIR